MLSNAVLDYEFDPSAVYLIANTYGPASQCLCGLLLEAKVKPIVCHVNYHLNPDSERAETELGEFCRKHDLILEVCDTKNADQHGKEEDYPAWQRKIRYAFFEQVYRKYNAAALFIAHMQDDLLESYLTAKSLGIQKAKYGISSISTYNDMIVVRPLLAFSRNDLTNYCDQKLVPYLAAANGFEHIFTTAIRQKISQMNEVERDQLSEEMMEENSEKINFINGISKSFEKVDELSIRSIIALSHDEFAKTIMDFVNRHASVHISITAKMLNDIRTLCFNKEPNATLKLKGSVYMIKEYDVLTLDTDGLDMPYAYTLDEPMKFSCETFDLDFTMGAEDRNIKPTDYPLTVRSVLPQDVYVYGGYLVPIKRMLVAAGISQRLLHVWPVFLDKNGRIIYVPRYMKGYSEHHQSVLNIHVTQSEK